MTIPGFTSPGGPVLRKELLDAWMQVYLGLNLIQSRDPEEMTQLKEMKDHLMMANELVVDILGD